MFDLREPECVCEGDKCRSGPGSVRAGLVQRTARERATMGMKSDEAHAEIPRLEERRLAKGVL